MIRSFFVVVLLVVAVVLLAPPKLGQADEDAWRSRLDTSDPAEFYKVVRKAAERKDVDAALPLLEAGVEARFPHLAVTCGEALRGNTWLEKKGAHKAFQKWVKKANRAKGMEAQNLARVLAAWGDPIVDEPLAALASGRRTPEIQGEALSMAAILDPARKKDFPETRAAILKALKGRSDDVKAAACSAAARMGDETFLEPLVALVRREKEKYAGLYAVWALKQLGYTGGVDTFMHVLGSNPKKTTMQACLKAVTELATKADIPSLLTLSKHNKKDYRDAATLALARLAHRGGYTQDAAVTGEPAEGPSSQSVPDAVIDRFMTLIREEKAWEVRDAARQGLLKMGGPAAATVRAEMPKLIEFSDEDTRQTALELCGLFQAKDAYGAAYKAALYDKSRTIRMFAARALEGIDAESAVKEFSEVAKSAARKTRDYEFNAVRALGYIRHDAAFEVLVELIEEQFDNADMMREVEFALERLTGHRFGMKPDRWRAWRKDALHPFHPMIMKYDRTENRRAAVEKGLYGLSRDTERAVERGLRWLELQQHPIGYWDGNEKGFGGVVGCEPAYTGLSLLAFVGAGYEATSGKYREVIRRSTEFLAATQFYDGGFPVTGGGDDSWIFAYLIAMGIWGITESYALSGDPLLAEPAQWGIDYLVRVQTPGGGWRYGPRYVQSDTSCTSWVLMTVKAADLVGLDVSQRCLDGIDSWLERCSYDITGEEEVPDDLSTDYDYEVGSRRYFKAFTSYFELSGADKSGAQQTSMTAVGMVCRFFMGWKRSHPYMIGSANYLMDYLPNWMRGLEKGQSIAWYHYFWYYGTLAMHQMGGRYWRAWNEKIKRMYPEKQRTSPPDLAGSWDPDTAVLNGGRLFSTAMSILSLETYYRFSPLLGGESADKKKPEDDKPDGDKPDGDKPADDKPEGDEPPAKEGWE